jgi:plasmid stability protein
MATITIKNIPDQVYEGLKQRAKIRHRSLNGEIIHLLEKSLKTTELTPEEVRMKAKIFREKVKEMLSPEEIEDAISEGRP